MKANSSDSANTLSPLPTCSGCVPFTGSSLEVVVEVAASFNLAFGAFSNGLSPSRSFS